jgi:hypothetical protein
METDSRTLFSFLWEAPDRPRSFLSSLGSGKPFPSPLRSPRFLCRVDHVDLALDWGTQIEIDTHGGLYVVVPQCGDLCVIPWGMGIWRSPQFKDRGNLVEKKCGPLVAIPCAGKTPGHESLIVSRF